jgi:hypothetical protein
LELLSLLACWFDSCMRHINCTYEWTVSGFG